MSEAGHQTLFGRLAVQFGLITMDQLSQAVQVQAREAREGRERKLGEILVEQGWMTLDEQEALLDSQDNRRRTESAPACPAAEVSEAPSPRAEPAAPDAQAPGSTLSPAGERASATVAQRALDSIPRVAASCPQLDPWIHQALARGASDLHLHVGCPPKARVYGELVDLATPPVTPEDTLAIVQALLEPSQLEALRERGQVDLAVPLADEVFAQAGQRAPRLRVNVYRQRVGLDFVARLVPAAPPTLSSLGLPLELARLANYPQGLVLITGPMGCGKTNTLAALLDLINEERSEHIITAEDPIEFVHAAKRCVVNQREVGVHSRSYARILRAALREDPDVIALAELRDPESVELALSAAETGHLVLATLHTASAVGTVHRILGSFPPARQEHVRTQLAESLRAVVSQRLARRADGKGRVPVLEILTVTPAVAHLMRDNKLQQIRSQIQTGSSQGMCLLENSASDLVRRGIIDAQEAARFASDGAREVAA